MISHFLCARLSAIRRAFDDAICRYASSFFIWDSKHTLYSEAPQWLPGHRVLFKSTQIKLFKYWRNHKIYMIGCGRNDILCFDRSHIIANFSTGLKFARFSGAAFARCAYGAPQLNSRGITHRQKKSDRGR